MDKYKTVPFNVTIPNGDFCWGWIGKEGVRCKYFDPMTDGPTTIESLKCWLGFKIKNESSRGFYRPEACVVLSQKEVVKDA